MLNLKQIFKSYSNGNVENEVLSNISLDFLKGTINTVFGISGVGKTTLLNIAGLLDIPTKGNVYIHNKEVNFNENYNQLRIESFGYIFQNHHLMQEYTVFENLLLPNVIVNMNYHDNESLVLKYMNNFNIEHLKDNYPNRISSGEAQRVSIIRSLMREPNIIIADEPTANLDDANSHLIAKLLNKIREKNNTIIIIASHDKRFLDISDNNYKLYNKKISKI